MRHRPIRLVSRGLLSVLLLGIATGSASANFFDLLQRVPDSTNTLVMIDVERLLMSPIAMKEKWREKGNSGEGKSLHFPINAERYMLASKLNFVSELENIWDVAMIETMNEVSLPYLAKTEGGYLDTVEGQQVAFSPRNAFFVSFKPTILGVAFPANRQDLARWLRSTQKQKDPQVSDYLRNAITLAHGKDHMVIAIDLGDLFTTRQVRDLLHSKESLSGKNLDLDVATKILTSMKGITLTMTATDRLNGKVRVDLGESPTPLKEVAKALFFEALENQGMMLDEMRDWTIQYEAKAVVLEGRLTGKGLRTLTDLIPFPAETLALQNSDSKAAGAAPAGSGSLATMDTPVAISRKYYQHISLLIDQVATELKDPNMTPKLAQRRVTKAATEIDRLPVLNVDEELIAYGTGVSETFRNMRNLSRNENLDASYRQAGIAASGSYGYGYGYGGFYGGVNTQLASTVMNRQQTAVLKSNELAVVTMLEEKTAAVRKKMTLKHKVEF